MKMQLIKLDLKNISREFILIILLPVPLFLALLLKIGFNPLVAFFSNWIDLSMYSSLFLIFLITMGPLLVGMMTGLMLVDEGDENILSAIAVTPLGRKGYLIHKLMTPFIWTFFTLIFVPLISGLWNINYFYFFPIILTASLGAPLEALIISVLANNKIEAMAIGKMTGVLFIAPFISWFAPFPWKFLGGVLPSFWVSESFYSLKTGGIAFPVFISVGLLINCIFIILLLKKFNSRVD